MQSKFFRPSLLLILTVVLSTACGSNKPGTGDAYQDGSQNCSSQFVSDYNNVIMTYKSMNSMSDLTATEALVSRFAAKYAGVICNAQNASNLSSTSINVDAEVARWQSGFKKIRAKIAEADAENAKTTPRPSAPIPAPAPAPGPEVKTMGRDVAMNTLSGFTLTVNDAYAMTRLYNADGKLALQKGRVVDGSEMSVENFCVIRKIGPASFTNGQTLILSVEKADGINLLGAPADFSYAVACARYPETNVSLTVAELDAIFAGIAKVSFTQ